jgi:D-sedoheptulose 7-phosphate isomerase
MSRKTAEHLQTLSSRYPQLGEVQNALMESFSLIEKSLRAGGTLFLCGNGGSAADAEHIAGELLKAFLTNRPLASSLVERLKHAAASQEDTAYLVANLQQGLRAIALTGHPSLATAMANDVGADLVFAQQLTALAREGDVLLGISTSGNARNVVLAVELAAAMQMKTIALTGVDGGQMAEYADVAIRVPARVTHEVQELHVPVYHTLCAMLESAFFQA